MTIYSSDYNARTRELVNDRGQRARETALNAAVSLSQNDGTAFYGHSSERRAQTTLMVAEMFLSFLTPPQDEVPTRDMPGIPL